MPDDFAGKHTCEFCDDVAIYRGAGMKDNYRRYYNLCLYHGPAMLKEWAINTLEEHKEFKEWKRKQIKEAQSRHPTNDERPQLRLVDNSEK